MPEICQGNSYKLTYNITEDNGDPLNLSDTTELKYAIGRNTRVNPTLEFTLVDATKLNIADAVNGTVEINISAEDVNTLEGGRLHIHVLWHLDSVGVSRTLMSENIMVNSKLIRE